MKKQLLILLVVGLGGCSVKRDTVANNPPRIPSPSEQKFTSEAGTLNPQTISIFLWPENWKTEDEIRTHVRDLNRASAKIDDITKKLLGESGELETLTKKFSDDKCAVTYGNLGPDDDPDLMDQIPWKAMPTDPAGAAGWTACVSNQDRRLFLKSDIDTIKQKEFIPAATVASQIIDPGYPKVVTNARSVNAQASKIVFGANGDVEIVLKDFILTKVTQSSKANESKITNAVTGKLVPTPGGQITHVVYDSTKRSLSFTVPELGLNAQGDAVTTGGVYEFNLARAANFLTFARFVGDVKYTNGSVSRLGSIKIDGVLETPN